MWLDIWNNCRNNGKEIVFQKTIQVCSGWKTGNVFLDNFERVLDTSHHQPLHVWTNEIVYVLDGWTFIFLNIYRQQKLSLDFVMD